MKCAWITGGPRGIARAICLKLAAQGYYVLINYKGTTEQANQTLGSLKEAGGNGELMPFDVSDKGGLKQTIESWIEANPDKYIEVLVNNAGIRDDSLLAWMADEQWDNVLKTNLDSFFHVTRLVLNG